MIQDNPMAAHLLSAMQAAAESYEHCSNCARSEGLTDDDDDALLARFKQAIADAEDQGLRAQSFSERVTDLLEANNRHEEAARAARSAHNELLLLFDGQTRAYAGQFIKMGQRNRRFRQVLGEVLPLAEALVSTVQEVAEGYAEDHPRAAEARAAARKAIDAVQAAKPLLEVRS